MKKTSVLFVCMGNICRSPTAQGIFEQQVLRRGWAEQIRIDSAGTHAYHIGEPPDARACSTANLRGIDLSTQRARQVLETDFTEFDYILAMDRQNLALLSSLAPSPQQQRLYLFMQFAKRWQIEEVPDPYYGGERGFEQVLHMIEDAAEGLLEHVVSTHFADNNMPAK